MVRLDFPITNNEAEYETLVVGLDLAKAARARRVLIRCDSQVVTAAHRLKPYFQAHIVVVLTDKPLRRTMSNPEAVGRMALWVIELNEYNVQYCTRIAIKGHVVAYFIAEFTHIDG